jgi:hypothetical protein
LISAANARHEANEVGKEDEFELHLVDASRVVANHPIKDRALPIFSFGEDEMGEVYLLTSSVSGQGIYWFERGATKKKE